MPRTRHAAKTAKAIASLKQVINTSTGHQNAINELTMASRNTPDLTQILQKIDLKGYREIDEKVAQKNRKKIKR